MPRFSSLRPCGRTIRLADGGILSAGIALGMLAGCAFLPAAVDGIPTALPWTALPLKAWIAEGGVHADAISFCDASGCAAGTVTGRFTATGAEARDLEDMLRHPARLQAMLDGAERERQRRLAALPERQRKALKRVPSRLDVSAIGDLAVKVVIARQDGSRAVVGILRGERDKDALKVTIATGRTREALGRF